jgi:hypothetical protein
MQQRAPTSSEPDPVGGPCSGPNPTAGPSPGAGPRDLEVPRERSEPADTQHSGTRIGAVALRERWLAVGGSFDRADGDDRGDWDCRSKPIGKGRAFDGVIVRYYLLARTLTAGIGLLLALFVIVGLVGLVRRLRRR